MKNFLSKYWKRILILIAIILILMNLIHKTAAPHTLVSEFAEYGPTVESSGSVDIHPDEIISEVEDSSPLSGDMFRIAMILAVGILAALIISDLANKKASAPKKK